jgi:hypothetical protein
MSELILLTEAEQLDEPEVRAAFDAAEDWYADEPRLDVEGFLDRIATYARGYDLEAYDNAFTRRALREARERRREG